MCTWFVPLRWLSGLKLSARCFGLAPTREGDVWHSSVAHGDQDSERLVGGGLDMQVFQTLGKKMMRI
jgi:hypothetical protein